MKRNRPPSGFWKHPIQLIACGFGAGAAPYAPGTAGTLAAIPVYLLLQLAGVGVYLAATVVALVAGIWICDVTARAFGVHDHGAIVWDEVVGFLIGMTLAPAGWLWIVAGFFLFRVFDVLKPWPARWVDRHVAGGMGIMLDDVVAGLYTWVGIQGAAWLVVQYPR